VISGSCSNLAAERGLERVLAALGLTGEVRPEDFERLSELVTDEDEDQDGDDVRPYAAKPAAVSRLSSRCARTARCSAF